MRRNFVLLPMGMVLSLVLAACGGGEQALPTTAPTGPNGVGTDISTTAPPVPAQPPSTPAEPGAAPANPAVGCPETKGWGTGTEGSSPYSSSSIYLTRIGQHKCYDRVVFDLNGPERIGYHVSYVPVVTEDGSGREIPVEGGAVLQVIVHAWTTGSPGDKSGDQPWGQFPPSGEYLHGPSGLEKWEALRAVRSAGSFEGQSTFAVGVRERLPFEVTTWVDGNQIAHVIIDIAHQ
jgi:hypothetical protein